MNKYVKVVFLSGGDIDLEAPWTQFSSCSIGLKAFYGPESISELRGNGSTDVIGELILSPKELKKLAGRWGLELTSKDLRLIDEYTVTLPSKPTVSDEHNYTVKIKIKKDSLHSVINKTEYVGLSHDGEGFEYFSETPYTEKELPAGEAISYLMTMLTPDGYLFSAIKSSKPA